MIISSALQVMERLIIVCVHDLYAFLAYTHQKPILTTYFFLNGASQLSALWGNTGKQWRHFGQNILSATQLLWDTRLNARYCLHSETVRELQSLSYMALRLHYQM